MKNTYLIRYAVFSLLIIFSASIVSAQPVISQVDGEWENNAILTINGVFNQKINAEPLLWDTLENQSSYSNLNLSHDDIIPSKSGDWGIESCEECPWYSNQPDWSSPMKYWDQNHRTLNRPFYRVVRKGWFRMNDLGDESPDQFYLSWWFRTSAEDLTDGSNKFVRLWADSERAEGSMSWTGMHMTYTSDSNHDGINDGGDGHGGIDWGSWGGQTGEWHHMELIYDGSGDIQNGYGQVQLIRNGHIIHDIYDAFGELPWNRLFVFGFDASSGSTFEGETFDFSEIYIDTNISRVIAGNASNISEVTHMELQIPITWNENQIEVMSNYGSFEPDEDVWLYVYDNEGNVNTSGFFLGGDEMSSPGLPGQPIR